MENKNDSGKNTKGSEFISLETLAKLTGFSQQFIKEEFQATGKSNDEDLYSLNELREIMIKYLDVAMLKDQAV